MPKSKLTTFVLPVLRKHRTDFHKTQKLASFGGVHNLISNIDVDSNCERNKRLPYKEKCLNRVAANITENCVTEADISGRSFVRRSRALGHVILFDARRLIAPSQTFSHGIRSVAQHSSN